MIILDATITKYRTELATLYERKAQILEEDEDISAVAGSELEILISQIDALIEGDYAKAVFDHYSISKPELIRTSTGDEVQWLDAFGDSFTMTTAGQRHALVGLIEGGSKYRFK